jgi:hypothetical protein
MLLLLLSSSLGYVVIPPCRDANVYFFLVLWARLGFLPFGRCRGGLFPAPPDNKRWGGLAGSFRSGSHYEIQQQHQQESAKMNIVLSTAESEKQRSSSVT